MISVLSTHVSLTPLGALWLSLENSMCDFQINITPSMRLHTLPWSNSLERKREGVSAGKGNKHVQY